MAKKKEPTKVLLINFDKATANNVQTTTGVEIVRGYIGNHDSYSVDSRGNQEPSFEFYTPTPPYECAMVFVNLGNYDDSETEFGDNAKLWSATETKNLYRYWSFRSTVLVFFVDNTKVTNMISLGVPLSLSDSSGVDKQSTVTLDKNRSHYALFEELDEQILMPNAKYIVSTHDKDNGYYRIGTKLFLAIRNANSDTLAAVLTKANDDYDMDEPGVIVLPTVKQPSGAISKMIKHFAQHYEIKLSDADWLDSDIFYPSNKLEKLSREIQQIIEKARKEVDSRQQEIVSIKSSYSYLKDLLTQKDEPLVEAVYRALTELIKLKVTKSDDKNGSSLKEDLLVEVSGKKILLEVKGTKRQNPSLKFPQQAMQHAIRQGLSGLASTGLVLNHDFETDPNTRTLAYSDKESKELITDIHFIDTRVLHAISLDIIDGKLKPNQAVKVLFESPGRVEYSPRQKK